ncbi:MAG: hypothetical protein H6624_10285 [Bdellovibrionaceae bacterium]|nr:hypothetical protein [Bdellovibrionales bacterium]MCB9084722.1 hypothetical protein [Pseudobdellovibrionaceae bacterium]
MKREVNFTEPGWFCRSTTFSLFVLFLSFGFALQVQADCLNEDGICYDSGSWKPPVAPSATVTTPPASGQTVAGNSYAGEFDGVDIQGPPETIQHTPEMDFGATNVDNSDFAGVGPDGGAATTSKCNSAYIQASNSCVNAAKTADTVGGAAIAGESSKAHNGSIQGGAQGLKNSSEIAAGGNQAVAATCEQARQYCSSMCSAAITTHNNRSQMAAQAGRVETATRETDLAKAAKETQAKCNVNLGTMSGISTTQAVALGGAALLAGGVLLATKSGGKKGDSAAPGGPGGPGGGGGGGGSGPGSGIDAEKFWADNQCDKVIKGEIEASDDIKDTCRTIAGQLGYGNLVLGSCADEGQHSTPACFDPLNDYCMTIDASTRLEDSYCASFCGKVDHADSCQQAVAPGGGTPTPFSSPSGSTTSSSTATPFSSGGSSGGSTTSASTGTTTSFASTGTASNQAMDCSHPQMVGQQQCYQPMRQYCSQYGTRGKGCAGFCQIYKNICPN